MLAKCFSVELNNDPAKPCLLPLIHIWQAHNQASASLNLSFLRGKRINYANDPVMSNRLQILVQASLITLKALRKARQMIITMQLTHP